MRMVNDQQHSTNEGGLLIAGLIKGVPTYCGLLAAWARKHGLMWDIELRRTSRCGC